MSEVVNIVAPVASPKQRGLELLQRSVELTTWIGYDGTANSPPFKNTPRLLKGLAVDMGRNGRRSLGRTRELALWGAQRTPQIVANISRDVLATTVVAPFFVAYPGLRQTMLMPGSLPSGEGERDQSTANRLKLNPRLALTPSPEVEAATDHRILEHLGYTSITRPTAHLPAANEQRQLVPAHGL